MTFVPLTGDERGAMLDVLGVKSVEELKSLIEKAGKTVALLVQRQDARIFIPVTLG